MKKVKSYSVLPLDKCALENLFVQKVSDDYGRLYSWELNASNYDRFTQLVYASHKEEVLEQLDELIDKLSAIRQDVDTTEV